MATCGASLVVCNLQWNREAVGKQAKRRMKQVARGVRDQMLPGELKKIEEGELDVFAALMDQVIFSLTILNKISIKIFIIT